MTRKERINKADRKVSKKIRQSFNTYIECSKIFKFSGSYHGNQVLWDEDGVDALKAFNALDSMGFDAPCNQPYLLMKALDGKAALNLTIRQWADGIRDGLFLLKEFQEDYPWLPSWVWEAITNQAGTTGDFSWYYDIMFGRKAAVKYWLQLGGFKRTTNEG